MEIKGHEEKGIGWIVDADYRVREVGYVVRRRYEPAPVKVYETWDGNSALMVREVYGDLADARGAARLRILGEMAQLEDEMEVRATRLGELQARMEEEVKG